MQTPVQFLSKNKPQLYLSFCFIFGLLLGVITAYFAIEKGDIVFITSATFTAMLPVLVFVAIVPLAISFLAVQFSAAAVLLPLCIIKSFCYGYCSCGVFMAYQDAGWLVRGLLLFSDSFLLVPLVWFWLRHLNGSKDHLKSDAILYLSFSLIVCFFDYLYISPFLALLLQG